MISKGGETSWTLMLKKQFDTTDLTISEILESATVSIVGDYQGDTLQPIIFSAIVCDGTSFFCNNKDTGEGSLKRLHFPFSALVTTYDNSPPSAQDMVEDLQNQASLFLESYFKNLTWDSKTLFSQCFSLELGEGPVFELADDDTTAIVPVTISLRKTVDIRIQDDSIFKVVLEDLIDTVGSDIDGWEPFSIQLVEQLMFGSIFIPAEPFSREADLEELGYGDDA